MDDLQICKRIAEIEGKEISPGVDDTTCYTVDGFNAWQS